MTVLASTAEALRDSAEIVDLRKVLEVSRSHSGQYMGVLVRSSEQFLKVYLGGDA